MSLILNGLYLGTWTEGHSRFFLNSHSISHILVSVSEIEHSFPKYYNYKTIPLQIDSAFDASTWFDVAANFIFTSLEDGTGCLVHDFKGDSRSTSCVMAYMIKFMNLSFEQAFKKILEKKNNAKINRHYQRM